MIGTLAALAWLIASSVWGMTPSSAATTTTAMSVTLAPRARMAVNASWPGVSRKTTRLPSCVTSLAPMCWVMPPRSPAATSVVRMASRRLVLPWSTWPMTVTIGARGCRSAGSSSSKRSSLVASAGSPSPSPSAAVPVAGRLDRLGDLVAELAGDERRGVAVDELVDRREDAALDELADDVRRVDRQQLGELLDGDRRGQLDRATLARVERPGPATGRTRRRDAAACGARDGRGCRSYSWPRAPPSMVVSVVIAARRERLAQVGGQRGLRAPVRGRPS